MQTTLFAAFGALTEWSLQWTERAIVLSLVGRAGCGAEIVPQIRTTQPYRYTQLHLRVACGQPAYTCSNVAQTGHQRLLCYNLL